MQLENQNGYIDITELFSKNVYDSFVVIRCPVSVEILDPVGKVVYTLEDGAEGSFYTEYGNFHVFKEEDGGYGKTLDLKEGYTARIVGRDTGTMKIDCWDITDKGLAETPKSFVNVPITADFVAVLKIYSSADKFKTAIAEVKAVDGIFTIDNSVISDQTLKYKAQLETTFGETTVKSSQISLNVKMGNAKLTVKSEDTTLFSKDKNDRAVFQFESVDATLNDIAKAEFKNAKQANMFERIYYDDGTYAIAFKDGKVDKSLIGKTVTVNLNVFLEGNQTAKANASVNVKLTIVK